MESRVDSTSKVHGYLSSLEVHHAEQCLVQRHEPALPCCRRRTACTTLQMSCRGLRAALGAAAQVLTGQLRVSNQAGRSSGVSPGIRLRLRARQLCRGLRAALGAAAQLLAAEIQQLVRSALQSVPWHLAQAACPPAEAETSMRSWILQPDS